MIFLWVGLLTIFWIGCGLTCSVWIIRRQGYATFEDLVCSLFAIFFGPAALFVLMTAAYGDRVLWRRK